MRLALTVAAVLSIVLSNADSAVAHVTLIPTALPAGATAAITFRCPNERPTAATTMLVVQMPVDAPIAFVTVRPAPGWHSSVTMRKLDAPIHTASGDVSEVVDTVTWAGGTIAPGERGEFTIVIGPIPSGVTELPFKAIQTYANGEVVRWIELRASGEPEPPHPAPVLHVR